MPIRNTIYINVKGKLMDLSQPQVMGILNVTPDSFYAESRIQTEKDTILRLKQIIDEGASIVDIGAYSSRPNAQHISTGEEMERLRVTAPEFEDEDDEALFDHMFGESAEA